MKHGKQPSEKVMVIENEMELSDELLHFLKTHFVLNEVNIQVACVLRSMEDIGRHIAKADTIVFQSTFGFKKQFVDFVHAFANNKFGEKTYTFYIFEPLDALNDFLKDEVEPFIQDLFTLVSINFVYGFDAEGNYREVKVKDKKFVYA